MSDSEETRDLRACGCRYDTEHTYGCPFRGGMITSLTGMPVYKSGAMADGKAVIAFDGAWSGGECLFIGTCPPTALQRAGRDARLAVRRGLADVLAWLGQAVENEPTGEEIYAALLRRTHP